MWGRPLCVASVFLVGILVIWHAFMNPPPGDNRWEGQVRLTCQVEQIRGLGEPKSIVVRDVMSHGSRLLVYGPKDASLFNGIKIGQIISIAGTASSFSLPGNPGQFNEYQYYTEQGIQCKCFAKTLTIEKNTVNRREQWLYEFRSAWYDALLTCLPKDEAGIMAAMLLGEKSGLAEETGDLYRENGIVHILAISGLHISLLGAGLFYLLRFVMPMRAAAGITALFLVLYGELTGFSIPTKRAVLMMLCMLLARFLGRKYDRLSALSLSAMLQLAFRPGLLFQSGFLLSYGTVLGICVFVDAFRESVPFRKKWWEALSGSVGIFLVTLPILLYFYFEWNPYSALLNMLVLPFVSVLLVMTVFGSGLSVFWVFFGRFFSGTVHLILRYYESLCRLAEMLPWHRIVCGRPKLWRILVYYSLLGCFCLLAKKKRGKYRVCLVPIALFVLLVPEPSPGLVITNLDVGQGDCAVVRMDGKVVMIDGGSSDVKQVAKYRIVPYLKYCGIQTVDYIFITHSDSDHTNGLMEILQDDGHMGLHIGTVVMPDIAKKEEGYERLERKIKEAGVRIIKMSRGGVLRTRSATWKCLHPPKDYEWKSENDYSLVMQVEYGDFRGLFTGDLEEDGEREALSYIMDVDYLKVGHHGSKGSSSEVFLAGLKPEKAVISAGRNNRYGHPAKETLARLDAVDADVYSTISCGAVTVTVVSGRYQISRYIRDGPGVCAPASRPYCSLAPGKIILREQGK